MRALDYTLDDIHHDLALDEALLIAAEERGVGPLLRFWERPALAVVLGASRKEAEDVHLETCRADGVTIARRGSGGGTVLLGPGALNVAWVLAVKSHPELGTVNGAQAYVLGRCAEAISGLGASVEVRGSGDLTVRDRKCAGSAQRRLRDHVLVHASILYDFNLSLIAEYLREPSRRPDYRGDRAHETFVTNLKLPRARIATVLRDAFKAADSTFDIPQDLVTELVATKYADPEWISRF